ncbi:MAG: cupin domain-containing protein [Phenylobacterium sp.]|uniref:cupin domain-containing protein n=1 Tax=Phenylobacterium sp. TaxID=1871053 RepID=UPI00391AD25A
MRKLTIVVLAAAAIPTMALASAQAPAVASLAQSRSGEPLAGVLPVSGKVRMAVSQTTIPAGESLPEHVQPTLRYIYVVSGRVRVSNLVTGVDQEISPGEMAVETEGQLHIATALDGLPADILLIEGDAAEGAIAQP